MAQTYWDGGGGNNRWSTRNNWNPNTTPGSGTTVIFDNTYVGTLPSSIQLRGNRNANILTFDTANTLSLVNGTGSRALNLYSGQINRTTGSSGSQSIAFSYLDLQANGAFNINGSGTFTISSIIRNEGGTWSVTKTGNGVLVLSGVNTYGGSTNVGTLGGVDGGTLRLGANNVLPDTAVNVYAGTLDVNTRTDTIGALSLGGGASGTTASITGTTGTLTLGGNITYLATNNPNGATISSKLALGGNRVITVGDSTAASADLTISGVISGSSQGIDKQGAGTLVLSGSNTYTGVTTVTNGVLSVSSIGDGGSAGNIGQATNAADRIVLNGGTLRYTGSAASTNRLFTVGTSGGSIDASGSGALNLTNTGSAGLTGTNTARTLTLTGTNTGNNTYAGVLGDNGTGATSLTKDSTGTWILSGANTYTGTTTVNNGILATSAANRIADGSALNIGASGTFRLGGNETVGALSGSGSLNIQGNDFTTSTSANTSFSGVISGWGSFTKAGTGDLTLSGNSTYSGLTYITGGTLIAAHANALGGSQYANVISSGATLGLQGGITLNQSGFTLQGTGDGGVGAVNNISGTNTLNAALNFAGDTTIGSTAGTLNLGSSLDTGTYAITMTGAGDINASSNMYGSGSLTKEGTGTLTLSGASANSFSGNANFNNGTTILSKSDGTNATGQGTLNVGDGSGAAASAIVRLNNNNQIFDSSNVVIASDGQLDLNNYNESIKQLSGSGQVALGSGGLTIGTSGGGDTTYSGVISGTGSLTKISNSTLTLSGSNTYTGNTTVSAGTLQLGASNALSDSTAVTVAGSATFDVNGVTDTVGSIAGAGNITLGGGTLTSGGNNTNTTFSGIISESGSLTKTGTGTLTLSGSNTYSGTTTVSNGTLLVQSDSALGASTGAVTVNSGGTLALDGGLSIDKSSATLTLAGNGYSGAGALAAVGSTGSTTQYDGNIALSADATITAADNLLIIGDNYYFTDTINLGSHTLTLNTTSATGVTPTYDYYPSYALDDSNIYITSTVTGSGGLTKTGDGTVNLIAFPSTGQAYTGDTVITGGKLIVDGNGEVSGYYDPTINSSNVYVGNSSGAGAADSVVLQLGQLASPPSANYLIGHYDIGTNTATTSMTIYEDGLFNLNGASNRLDHLTLQGGHITGGDLDAYNPLLTVVDGVTTLASSQTALIEELNFGMSANGFTFDVADGTAAVDLQIDGILQNGIGFTAANNQESMIKTGAGTMVLTNANSYQGVTDIQQGILNIQHNSALGQYGTFGSLDNGTVVETGAQLQLDGNGGDLTINTESLTLNGTGVSGTGALRNVDGDNTYKGFVYLESDSRINADSGTTLEIGNYTGAGSTLNVNGGIMTGVTAGQDLTVGGAGNTIINGAIGNNITDINKDGTGTLTLAGNNSYAGATDITSGAVKITHNSGLAGTGATVHDGAALQFAQDAGGNNISAYAVASTIQGTGISNGGAIQNLNGSNSYAGAITLADDARITANSGSSLTMSGNVALGGNTLDAGGLGNTTYNGVISNGTVTKTDTGTVTFGGSGANTFTGGLNINDGTVNLNKTAGVNAVGAGSTVTVGDNIGSASSANLVYQANNQLPDSTALVLNSDGRIAMGTYSDSISTIAGTGLIDLGTTGELTVGSDNSNSIFDGSITGSGTLVKDGTGSLTFTEDISYTGTLELGGGTLVLSGMDLTVTNLVITADTVLDFSGLDSRIFATNLSFLSTDITLNIINWTWAADYFYATNFAGGTYDTRFIQPMTQIVFNSPTYTGDNTIWDSYDDQIYPVVPEPSTYGALFTALGLITFLWRKRAKAKVAAKTE